MTTTYKVSGRVMIIGRKARILRAGYLPGPVTTFWHRNAIYSAIAPYVIKTSYGNFPRYRVFPTDKLYNGRVYRRPIWSQVTTYKLATFADGGYPLVYITADACAMCATCATEQATRRDRDHWSRIVNVVPHYEGPSITCEGCSVEIESAYGDPSEPTEGEDN